MNTETDEASERVTRFSTIPFPSLSGCSEKFAKKFSLKIHCALEFQNATRVQRPFIGADLRLLPGCYGNLIVNVKCGQSQQKRACGLDPDTDTTGQRSRSRLSARYVAVALKEKLHSKIISSDMKDSFP